MAKSYDGETENSNPERRNIKEYGQSQKADGGPRLLDRVRAKFRLRHYAICTARYL